jgi:hypothetical protein
VISETREVFEIARLAHDTPHRIRVAGDPPAPWRVAWDAGVREACDVLRKARCEGRLHGCAAIIVAVAKWDSGFALARSPGMTEERLEL